MMHVNGKKNEKLVQMACPECKTVYGPQPMILLMKDGTSQLIHELPRKCLRCHCNLQRFAVEMPRGMNTANTILSKTNHTAGHDLPHDATIRSRDARPDISAH